MNKPFVRGAMFYAELGSYVGSEQSGFRPVIIIQNNIGNRRSSTVIVAAISSRISTKAQLPTHYYIGTESGLEQPSIVLLEQIRTVDKMRLGNYIGRLTPKQMEGLDRALAISVGFIQPPQRKIKLFLCKACAEKFSSTGAYQLRKIATESAAEVFCSCCNQRLGLRYKLLLKGREAQNE